MLAWTRVEMVQLGKGGSAKSMSCRQSPQGHVLGLSRYGLLLLLLQSNDVYSHPTFVFLLRN